jgi:hypothetical protein
MSATTMITTTRMSNTLGWRIKGTEDRDTGEQQSKRSKMEDRDMEDHMPKKPEVEVRKMEVEDTYMEDNHTEEGT